MYDVLIKNGMVIDGTGRDAFKADIAISDGRIVEIGDVSADAETVIDAVGKYVSPGFIDMHSHADASVPFYPKMEAPLGQGITTVFAGHCGLGVAPVNKYWFEMFVEEPAISELIPRNIQGHGPFFERIVETDKLAPIVKKYFDVDLDWRTWGEYLKHLTNVGIGVNMAAVVGHANLRVQIMGIDYQRHATKEEVEEMKNLLAISMREGSFGLGLGLDYDPGKYADKYELNELAKTVAKYDGMLTAHVRMHNTLEDMNKSQPPIEGFKEIMEIGLQTGVRVHISHICAGYQVEPYDAQLHKKSAERTLEIIDEYKDKGVKVSWDVLPKHTGSVFNFNQLIGKLYPYVMQAGGKKAFSEKLANDYYKSHISKEIKSGKHLSKSPFFSFNPDENPDWHEGFYIAKSSNEAYVGKNLKDIAKERNTDTVDVLLDLVQEDPEMYIARVYTNEKVADSDYFCAHPHACIGLDNAGFNYDYIVDYNDMPIQKTQPAAYNGMIKLLNYKLTSRIEDMIKNLTSNPSKVLKLKDRGLIREGMIGDIVVLDYENLDTNEDFVNPGQPPKGIDYVLVNGIIAVYEGKQIVNNAGKVLYHK
ncbi:amidohydrolase family protein [Clostridiaceae bacterium M8S5]|nr:amidohydrolase family protein [Clostridiaceae bacterium M8S5]